MGPGVSPPTSFLNSVKSFIKLTRTIILNYSKKTRKILFIDVSASRRKPSSGLTSGAGRQYVKLVPYVAQLVAPLVSRVMRRKEGAGMKENGEGKVGLGRNSKGSE